MKYGNQELHFTIGDWVQFECVAKNAYDFVDGKVLKVIKHTTLPEPKTGQVCGAVLRYSGKVDASNTVGWDGVPIFDRPSLSINETHVLYEVRTCFAGKPLLVPVWAVSKAVSHSPLPLRHSGMTPLMRSYLKETMKEIVHTFPRDTKGRFTK